MSSKKPLFAFFGTPELSVRVLERLEAHGLLPALVITAPDKPAGRGLALTPSPVKAWAEEHGIDVLTPESLRDEQFVAELRNTEWDVFVVAMYAKLIPNEILDLPAHGTLNVHPSLLPRFRGPSPVLSTILADERKTGVTIMRLSEAMDAGPIVTQAKIELDEAEWPPKGDVLEELLATEGGNLLAEALPFYIRGDLTPEAQDEALATYTKKFTNDDALIDLSSNARENFLKIQAFHKSPRARFFAEKGGKRTRLIIADAHYEHDTLTITRVIPEGKKEMDYQDFLRGA